MEEIIAFRNSSQSPLIDVVVNPYDKHEFATCGYSKIQIWRIVGKSLLVKENIDVNQGDKNQLPYITAISYSFYSMQNKIHNDLLIGTNFGDLGLVTQGNYVTVRKTAHKKMINCLLLSDAVRNVKFLLLESSVNLVESDNHYFWGRRVHMDMGPVF